MIVFMGKKLLYLCMTLFCVVTLTFILMHTIPGDPFTDENALPKEIHEALRDHYGLNDPLLKQYATYVKSVITLDLGFSLKYKNKTVNSIIMKSFPISALLGMEAILLSLTFGISFGVLAALKHHQWQDKLFLVLTSFGISLPSFILAVLLQYLLAIKWGLFPIARWGTFTQSVLPAISLAAMPTAYIARMVKCNMSEVLKSDYIKTAYSKGLPEWKIIYRHALKNTLAPLMPYFAQFSANILLGSFVIEKIFGIPGLGQWFVNSVSSRDYTMIMGLTVFYSFILLTLLFAADVIHSFLDPRVRLNDD